MGNRWVRGVLALVVIAVVTLLARYGASQVVAVSARMEKLGAWGPVAFVGVFAVASAIFIPAGLLTMTAGVLFGLGLGFVCAFIGATLGALLSFSVARYVVRQPVDARLRAYPKAASVINAVGADGFRIAALLRLSPVIPFNLINLCMAVTPMRFGEFAAACVAMIPVTLLYVYYGTLAGTIARAQEGHEHRSVGDYSILAAGLVITLLVTVYISRVAKRSLRLAPADPSLGAREEPST